MTQFDEDAFKGKRCLLTGGRSGLGRALLQRLLEEGAAVEATTRRTDAPIEHPNLSWHSVDLAQPESYDGFLHRELDLLKSIDFLVLNAGSGVFGNFDSFTPADIDNQLQLLLEQPIHLAHHVLQHMQARGSGCLVIVSSLAARFPLPGMPLYNASKAGLSQFAESLIQYNSAPGVRILNLQPGDFNTPFNDNLVRREHTQGLENAWKILEANLHSAPSADSFAEKTLRLMAKSASGTYRIGSFFQTQIAPLAQDLLPASLFRAIQRQYFGFRTK